MRNSAVTHAAEPRRRLLVMASTYPRWLADHEPGFVHELSKKLSTHFDVTVLCPHAPGAQQHEHMEGVEIVRYRYAPTALQLLVNDGGIVGNLRHRPWTILLLPSFVLGQLWSLYRLLKSMRPDVIHAHWILPQALAIALLQCIGIRTPPTLVTSHGADLFALRGTVPKWLKRMTLRRMQGYSVVSRAMLEPIAALGVDLEKVQVAPMGVDLQNRFTPCMKVQRQEGKLLFVGRLVEKKGLIYLIDALPMILGKHPDTTLDVVGFGPELERCKRQVILLGLQTKVRFLGAMPQEALPDMYRRYSILVTPFVQAGSGDQEGLGLVMVEALGCGCPVVTTRLPAIRELQGGQWPRYLAEPGDPNSLAREINKLLDNPTAGQAWAEQVRHSLLGRFDNQAVAKGYADHLSSLIAEDRTK